MSTPSNDITPEQSREAVRSLAAGAAAEDERFAALTEAGTGMSGLAARYEYGTLSDQFIEVYGEPRTASAVVIFVHGGYFRERTDITHARPLAVALAEAGALCVLIEYRRAGGAPNCRHDVTTAIDFTLGSLDTWGVGADARANLTVSGHSAGGCLVLAWASHLGEVGPHLRLRPLAPVTDLFREAEDGLGEGAVLDYMGVEPSEDLAAYVKEDPRSRAVLIPERVDVRTVHGDADRTVDVHFSRTFPAECSVLAGADHAELIDPGSQFFARVARQLGLVSVPV